MTWTFKCRFSLNSWILEFGDYWFMETIEWNIGAKFKALRQFQCFCALTSVLQGALGVTLCSRWRVRIQSYIVLFAQVTWQRLEGLLLGMMGPGVRRVRKVWHLHHLPGVWIHNSLYTFSPLKLLNVKYVAYIKSSESHLQRIHQYIPHCQVYECKYRR